MPFQKGNKIGHRFQPGESGNPSGRPKSALFSEKAREVLAEPDPKKRRTLAEALVRDAIKWALRHGPKKVLTDRYLAQLLLAKNKKVLQQVAMILIRQAMRREQGF